MSIPGSQRTTRRDRIANESPEPLVGRLGGHASAMDPLPPPLAFFFLLFSGWVNRQQQAVIDHLVEENRVRGAAHPDACASPTISGVPWP